MEFHDFHHLEAYEIGVYLIHKCKYSHVRSPTPLVASPFLLFGWTSSHIVHHKVT